MRLRMNGAVMPVSSAELPCMHPVGGTATDHSYTNGLEWDEGADAWANYEPLALMLPTVFLAMEWIYESPLQCRCVAIIKAIGHCKMQCYSAGSVLILLAAL